jgi:hypothetical protein
MLTQNVKPALSKDDPLTLKFWARSPQSVPLVARLQETKEPWGGVLQGQWDLSPLWQEYQVRGVVAKDYNDGGVAVVFQLASKAGTIELGGISLSNRPPIATGELLHNANFWQGGSGWMLSNTPTSPPEIIEITEKGAPVKRVVRYTVSPQPSDKPWSALLQQNVHGPLRADTPLVVRLWARAAQGAPVRVVLQDQKGQVLMQDVHLKPEWQEYEVRGRLPKNYEAEQLALVFQLAFKKDIIEIGNVRLFNDVPVPGDAGNLLANGDFSRQQSSWLGQGESGWITPPRSASGSAQTVSLAGAPLGAPLKYALRYDVSPQKTDQPWSIFAQQRIEVPLRKGQALRLRLWLRSPQSVPIAVRFQETGNPQKGAFSQNLDLGPVWKRYELRSVLTQDYGAGGLTLVLQLGFAKGTVEIAGAHLAVSGAGSGGDTGRDENLLQNGDFSQGRTAWATSDNANGNSKIVDFESGPIKQAMHFDVTQQKLDEPWAVLAQQTIMVPLRAERPLRLRVWMRSAEKNQIAIRVQDDKNKEIGIKRIILTPEWQQHEMPIELTKDYPAGSVTIVFQLAFNKGSIEIGDVYLSDRAD